MCLLITNQCGVFRIHICILLLFVTYDVQSVWPDAKATIDSSNTFDCPSDNWWHKLYS